QLAILHLLYARFYTKMLRDFDIVGVDEPFTNLLTQGMVCKETMRCKEHGYLFPDDVKDGKCTFCGAEVIIGKTEKMSKSLKNVVDPNYLISRYGADTARMFCLFAAPPEKDLEWSDQGVEGSFRFLGRTWRICSDYLEDIAGVAPFVGEAELPEEIKALRRKTHQTIKKVTSDIEDRFHFNTAISAIMELVNALYQTPRAAKEDTLALSVIRESVEAVVILLAPIVPHIAEELWEMLGQKVALADAAWPGYDPAITAAEEITIVIQVNGKVRSRITVPADESEEKIKELALKDEKVEKFIAGHPIVKEVYVPKKLVNIVVK
ncbi:MAG: class I tRNA ligase family protein, partial [Smithellaceae bacterium]|nr:class I tRNA ligase family protein [Smithellaceae bacterium]